MWLPDASNCGQLLLDSNPISFSIPSMSLHYTFPRSNAIKPRLPGLSREEQINKNLELQPLDAATTSHMCEEPYVGSFSCSNPNTPESLIILSIDDPIDDIVRESRRQISLFKMHLPGGDGPLFSTSLAGAPLQESQPGGSDYEYPAVREIPAQGQQPAGSETQKNEQLTAAPDLKIPVQIESGRKLSFSEDLSLDPLACHADNIMRMAMDSTLAHSFLSNFSNLLDDTHLEKSRRFPGFSERSVVEISAADLENAVNDPFRL